jgi:uncharacterized protein (TIGR02145 family)
MAENLNYAAEGSKCYDDDPANCEKFGRLYDWSTAMALPSKCNYKSFDYTDSSDECFLRSKEHQGICPEGWRVASGTDWVDLFRYVDEVTGGTNKCSGGCLGESQLYYETRTGFIHLAALDDKASKDPFGFSAPASGAYIYGSGYSRLYSESRYWTSTLHDYNTGTYVNINLSIPRTTKAVLSMNILKSENFLSVRCIKKD